nr:hypothetical protein [uncultured Flavobacterium sp.]
MKKALILSLFVLGFVFTAQAQNFSKNTIGFRLGDNDGFGSEISYQRGISSKNRIEFDLGWRNSKQVDAIKLTGLYQWIWNIDKGFNWYAGAGGGLGNWSSNGTNDAFLFVAGDIGIEYNFDFPLQLSLDLRPEIYLSDGVSDDFGPDLALGIRYRF